MAARLHESNSRIIIRVLETGRVRDELIMQAGFRQGFGCRQSLVDNIDDVLDGGGDDAAASC